MINWLAYLEARLKYVAKRRHRKSKDLLNRQLTNKPIRTKVGLLIIKSTYPTNALTILYTICESTCN